MEAILKPIGTFIPEEIINDQIKDTKEASTDDSPEFVKERMGEISEAIDRREEETPECEDEVQTLTNRVASVEIVETLES